MHVLITSICCIFSQNELADAQAAVLASARGAKETDVRAAIEKDWERKKSTVDQREMQAKLAAADAVVRGYVHMCSCCGFPRARMHICANTMPSTSYSLTGSCHPHCTKYACSSTLPSMPQCCFIEHIACVLRDSY